MPLSVLQLSSVSVTWYGSRYYTSSSWRQMHSSALPFWSTMGSSTAVENLILVILSVMGILLLPTLGLVLRITIRWTRTEDRLSTVIDDVKELISSQDKVHAEMLAQMRLDRDATDRRLRFLEEWIMRGGHILSDKTIYREGE